MLLDRTTARTSWDFQGLPRRSQEFRLSVSKPSDTQSLLLPRQFDIKYFRALPEREVRRSEKDESVSSENDGVARMPRKARTLRRRSGHNLGRHAPSGSALNYFIFNWRGRRRL